MDREIRALILEDNPADRELLERELRKGSIAFTARCVETRADFLRELEAFRPDIVLSDFSLPTFDGLTALGLTRELHPELPFIFVSGTIGEETAVQALTRGATDYLLKGHTKRLCQAVLRAVSESAQRAERKSLERQLFQAQKMEAIGQLAGGVAHDFNNLLTAILGYSQLMAETLPPDSPWGEHVTEIYKAGERARDLTRQLLAFSRKQIISPRVLDLNSVVGGMEKLLKRLIPENVLTAFRLAPKTLSIKADPGQIEQVIVNLAVNARDAMPNGGTITIETSVTDLDEGYTRQHAEVAPGRYAMLALSDNGTGMDDRTKAHLFEPFFTTKEPGKGTGLGLATVYGIVKQSGGHISVYSEVGIGTTFKVYFPEIREPLASPTSKSPSSGMPKGTETILVVEDDEPVRALIRRVLSSRGYNVIEAKNGLEALEVADACSSPIHLVMTDVIMPQMGGPELADHLKRRLPGAKVIFLSGYATTAIVQHGIVQKGVEFMEKPFTPEQLTQRVRQVLDSTPR
ncbi:MAG TPA: response regulator [Planctomycetota bacterium]|nr:response regulator [Planctomycetota bacterium]